MANTKYPLNGRYTTLGDLIHEYAISSVWPTNIDSIGSEGWEVQLATPNQPFTKLIFTEVGQDEFEADYPYDVVWFENVYAQDIYDPDTKRRKIIQADDTYKFGFDRYIIASEIANSPTISVNGIPFRFILPDKISHADIADGDDQSRYYYNYKLDNGEATVIYALQQIIDLLINPKYWDQSSSSNPNEPQTIDEKARRLKEFLFGVKNDQGEYGSIPVTYKEQGISQTATIYSLFYNNYWTDTDEPDGTIIEYDNQDRLFVKNDVYDRLGSYYWTELHVQYKNYTTNKISNLIPTVNTKTVIDNDDIDVTYKNLKELIYYTISGEYQKYSDTNTIVKDKFDSDDIRKSFLVSDDYTKLYYYCYWFLTTQRFHRSYITGCEFIKISNVTYLPKQPVLRCDLSLQRFIEKFEILNANHTVDTVLPAGPILDTTPITININYSAKYANIGKRTESSFELTLTFKQFQMINGNTADSLMWVRFYLPDDTRVPQMNNNQLDGSIYGSSLFPSINSVKNWSLKTIKWPKNEENNLEINVSKFYEAQNDINFDNGNCYKSTYDLNTYFPANVASHDKNEVYQKISNYINDDEFNRQNSFAPGGMIRFHSCYTQRTERQAQDSSYYLDVPLLRRKNYYYKKSYAPATDTEATDNIEVHLYFEPAYRDTTSARSYSSVVLNTHLVEGRDPENQPQTLAELQQMFEPDPNSNSHQDSAYYALSTANNEYYLTIKSRSGTMEYFVSGDSIFIPHSTNPNDTSFIHYDNLYIDKFYNAGEIWYENDTGLIQNVTPYDYSDSDHNKTETQSRLGFSMDNAFTYYRMYFSGPDESMNEVFNNNYIYFRINTYKNTRTAFTARYIKPIDCISDDKVPGLSVMGNTEDVLYDQTRISFITYHEDTVDNMNLKHTSLAFYDTGAEASTIYFVKTQDSKKDIIFKVSSIIYTESYISKYIYSTLQNYTSTVYIAYTYIQSYVFENAYLVQKYVFANSGDDIFNKIIIKSDQILSSGDPQQSSQPCKLYISLMPIYILCFIGYQVEGNVTDIQLNHVYYKRKNNEEHQFEEQQFNYVSNIDITGYQMYGYMATSFMNGTNVYLKPDSITVKLNGETINLGDSRLYDEYNVGLEYAFIDIDTNTQNIGYYGPTEYKYFTNNNEVDDHGNPIDSNINCICHNVVSGDMKTFRENKLTVIRASIHRKQT